MKLNYLLILLLLTAFIAEGASVTNSSEAVQLIEKSLLPQGKDNVGLRVWGPENTGSILPGWQLENFGRRGRFYW